MSGFGTAAAVLLAAILATAAAGKARRRRATERAFSALGVPAAPLVARAVPAVEALLAVALLWRPAVGGLAAVLLLTGFTAFLAARLRAGVTAPCGCFGEAAPRPLSVVALVRNGLLLLAAVAALPAARPVPPSLPAVLALLGAAASALLVLELVRLRVDAGRFWDNRLEAAS